MRKVVSLLTLSLLFIASTPALAQDSKSGNPDWAFNATLIEACSCPMFCQCYFNPKPAAHHHQGKGEHFCRANMAARINKGHYGSANLNGLKFWVAADTGGDLSTGEMEWLVLTFDKSMPKEQREAITTIMRHVIPVKWKSFSTAEGTVDKWEFNNDMAYATLDGGKSGEIKLRRFQGMTDEPIVIKNLKYWGVPRHDGFVLMPNEVEAYRVGPKAFEFKGTNGFMITVDINSKDIK